MSGLLKAGVYRHFKGSLYLVYELATHTENEESLVVYRPLYGSFALSVRPLDMFLERVTRDGTEFQRFTFMKSVDAHFLQDQDAARQLAETLSESF